MTRCLELEISGRIHTLLASLKVWWWGITLGRYCVFHGQPHFYRYPNSWILVGERCKFRSSTASNLIGINRPCQLSTLTDHATIRIGNGCGFSGTVIGCALNISLGDNVRCGANTLITDTDWHTDDNRTGENAPVSIGNNVWLGVDVIVLKGVTIGENTVVGAGSIVTRSLPENVYAAGIPAVVVGETRSTGHN